MKKLLIIIISFSFLTGCADLPLKAPCNSSGSNCWPRTKINQWNNN